MVVERQASGVVGSPVIVQSILMGRDSLCEDGACRPFVAFAEPQKGDMPEFRLENP